MSELQNEDGWLEQLEPQVVSALKDWVSHQEFDLYHEGWFSGGRSGEPVGRAMCRYNDDTRQVVVKFFKQDCPARITNLHIARRQAGSFKRHLAKTERLTIPLCGDWQAVFMVLAGGTLRAMRPLVELVDREEIAPDDIGAIIKSIVGGWNEGKAPSEPRSVKTVLGGILRHRESSAKKWAQSRGISLKRTSELINCNVTDVDCYLHNPFDLLTGDASQRQIDHFFIGKAHGDLNGRNILVPLSPTVDANSYALIDYDRYSPEAPLARDPMHLLVALALHEFESLKQPLWRGLAEVLVNPDRAQVSSKLQLFRQISQAVHKMSLPSEKGLTDKWSEQCLLSLVGAGLLHLGRDLDRNDEDEVKEWCLYLAALATQTYMDEFASKAQASIRPAVDRTGSTPDDGMVDRKEDVAGLHARLTNGPGGVAILRGAQGIGKTRLVNAVLTRLKGYTPHIHRHTANPITKLDTGTLVDYVAASAGQSAQNQQGSAFVRLEVALKALGDAPVVIAVDSAENLLDPETKQLIDPDLDDALEALANARGHRVTVLLVSQEEMTSPGGAAWPVSRSSIVLDQLPEEYFRQYLKNLDHDGTCDPDVLPEQRRAELHGKLLGNPRLAELGRAVVCEDGTGLDLPALTELLSNQDTRHVQAFLVRHLLDGVSLVRRRVLEALAAFGTPVPASAVIALLPNKRPDVVRRALTSLTASNVIQTVDTDMYTVSSHDARLILEEDSDANRTLYFRAASQLTKLQILNPRRVGDLRVHLARIKALLNAGEHRSAYGMIEYVHDLLAQWNCTYLLRADREELKGKLDDPGLELANHNALAGIYTSLDHFDRASDEFGRAFKLAERLHHDVSKVKIHLNLAAMYRHQNLANEAFNQYDWAHELAERLDRPLELMGALEGMSFCHQRFGEYDLAFDCATTALTLPDRLGLAGSANDQLLADTLRVSLALKTARWHTELGRTPEADRMLSVAQTTAARHPDGWLPTSYLDGQADLLYCRGDRLRAEAVAHSAVDRALQLNDRFTLTRARTTLSMIYLSTGRHPQAWDEIDRVQRSRREGRSLLVLALHALATHQRGDRLSAHDRFKLLLRQSTARTDSDSRDFAAWDFRGFALCGLHLQQRGDLGEAVMAFQKARSRTPRTPVLIDQMRFLLAQLHSDDLQPVIDAVG
ncbi:AAA family ATPase [Lentzea sp. NPDC060358]|uniref:AAA family ATPase n=1 Tax=Lentzea sp. NPDC060358 TaxID=3347103 RepID=UPI003662B02E